MTKRTTPVNIDARLADADWPKRTFDRDPADAIREIETNPIEWVRHIATLPSYRNAPPKVRRALTKRLEAGR